MLNMLFSKGVLEHCLHFYKVSYKLSNLVSRNRNLKRKRATMPALEEIMKDLSQLFHIAVSYTIELISKDSLRRKTDKEQDVAFLVD